MVALASSPQYAEVLDAQHFIDLCAYQPSSRYKFNCEVVRQADHTYSVDLMFTYKHRRYCTAAMWGFPTWNEARKAALAYAKDHHERIRRTNKAPRKVKPEARVPRPAVPFQKTHGVAYSAEATCAPGYLPPHLTAREIVEEATWGSPRNMWEPLFDFIGRPEYRPEDDLVRNVRELEQECPNCGQMHCSCCLKCKARWAFLEPIEKNGRFYDWEDAAKMECRCPKTVLSATHEERAEQRERQRCGACGGVSPFAIELYYASDEPVCTCAPAYHTEPDFSTETEGLAEYRASH